MALILFSTIVVLSGWGLGYLLAKAMRGKTSPTPLAVIYSLLAVATPTICAFIFSSADERSSLISQFHFSSDFPNYFLIAVFIPLVIVGFGHAGSSIGNPKNLLLKPSGKILKQVSGMIPILLIWALLEEIGWRGYLNAHLAFHFGAVVSSILVGVLWGIWHAPQMLFNEQLKVAMKGRIFVGMLLWSLQCVALGTVLGWMQLKSGTFLIPALAHALINYFGNISDGILGEKKNPILGGSSGAVALIVTIVIGCILFLCFPVV